MRGRGVGRKLRRLGAKYDGRHEKPLAQPTGDNKRIAAVVAWSREHQDRPATFARHGPGHFGCGVPGPLHQRQFARGGLDGPQFGGSVDRRQRRQKGHVEL